jgi:hypothetical protein
MREVPLDVASGELRVLPAGRPHPPFALRVEISATIKHEADAVPREITLYVILPRDEVAKLRAQLFKWETM